jgi:hypothetical protein
MPSASGNDPPQILSRTYEKATAAGTNTLVPDPSMRSRVDYVCRCTSNRAGARLLMACLLAKVHDPKVDPRKPYTEIGDPDSFSGRTYDERYITAFINERRLPLNPTTAFLTPTLRNISHSLTTDQQLVGRPRELYVKTLQLLEDVAKERIAAETVLTEAVRILILLRDEKLARMASLLDALKTAQDSLPLSTEATVTLISQHLACKNSSRLPVLLVAAAYDAAGSRLAEETLPLTSHNAADLQTGAFGDLQICLVGDNAVVTAYEMKTRPVTIDDIDAAATKIARAPNRIHNYLFVTTCRIDPDVADHAAAFYEETGGTEIAILDCIGFLRHFLHLFHRLRTEFLDSYQALLLSEPDSAVSQTLKEAFLALRHAAETGE